MSKKKYLRKNEFRFFTNKNYLSKKGDPHPAYISARQGHKFRFNVVTHTKTFFNEPTTPLSSNPNKLSKDPRVSRVSVPRWANANKENFSEERLSKHQWRFSKKDLSAVKKLNKKYK